MSLLLSLSQSLIQSVLQIFSSRTLKDYQPAYLADLLVRLKCSKYLRPTNSNNFVVPHIKTKTRPRAFSLSEPDLWNALYEPIRNAKTLLLFRKLLKSHLFDLTFPPLLLSSAAPCWRTCFGLDYDTWSRYGFVRLWPRSAEDIGATEL